MIYGNDVATGAFASHKVLAADLYAEEDGPLSANMIVF